MSKILKRIMAFCDYEEPSEMEFYSFVKEGMSYACERDKRAGYTFKFSEFGVFKRDKAQVNVKYLTGGGSLRFNIEKNFLDKIVAEFEKLEKENCELKSKLKKSDKIWQKMQEDCKEAINTTWRFIGAYKKENGVPISGALKSAEYHLKQADWIFDD